MRLARLTQRSEFLAAAEHGRRFRSHAFTVQVRDRAPDEPPMPLRLGLTASRKTGHAVERNLIRRRLRAAAALALAGQSDKACDVVVVARSETLGVGFDTLVHELSQALDRARPQRAGRPAARKASR